MLSLSQLVPSSKEEIKKKLPQFHQKDTGAKLKRLLDKDETI